MQLEKITKLHRDFKFNFSSDVQEILPGGRLATSPVVEEAEIVVRIEEKKKIVADLSSKILTHGFIILAIHGLGGIDKTTLAQLIVSDEQFKEYFLVWIYVSEVFDLKKIENSIFSQVSKRIPVMTDLETATANMNIPIVLDDLWEKNDFQLDQLKLKLQALLKLAKVIVIVTTREEAIGKNVSEHIEPYNVEGLTDKMCWHIIKHKSDFVNRDDKEQSELEPIGMEIARKCKGVALAAQSIGYTLHFKGPGEWESLKNSDIWNLSTSEDTSSSTHHVLAYP